MIEFTKWRDDEELKRLKDLQSKYERHNSLVPVIVWIIVIGLIVSAAYCNKHNRMKDVEAKNKAKIVAIYDIAKAETHSYSVADVDNDSICNIVLQNIIKKAKAQDITIYSATIDSAGLYVTYGSDGIVSNAVIKDMIYKYRYDLNTLNIKP